MEVTTMKQRKLMAILAVVLVLVLALGLAACNNKPAPPTPETGDQTGIYDEGVYSYRMGPSDLPTAWNVHTYQSNSSTYVLDYSSDSLYTFDYNEDYTGYVIVPSMAAGAFVDVTADYVGSYGITAGEENKAYAIPLKSNLTFDNGDPITAETFVESMQLLLNPEAANFRADNVYQSGDLKIYGAEEYVKGGSYAYSSFVSSNYGAEEYVAIEDTTVSDEGFVHWGEYDFAINVKSGGNWGSNSLYDYAYNGYLGGDYLLSEQGYKQYIDAEGTIRVLRADVTEGETTTTTYYLADGTTVIYRGTGMSFFYDAELTQPCEFEIVDAAWHFGLVQPLIDAADEDGYVKLTPELLEVVLECIAQLHGGTYEAYKAYCAQQGNFVGIDGDINYADVEWQEMGCLGKQWDSIEYEGNVGFFADDQGRLVVILKNAMEDNFYLKYELCTSFFLVHPETYRSCITYNQGVYTNTYGTSVDTYVGFGPYKLTQYLADSTLVLERNWNWHGYSEAEYVPGTYQTDKVVYTKVNNDDTRLEMFLKGELDGYGLQAKDMEDYISSSYIYYNDSESTWYLAMNPDHDTLEGLQASATPVVPGNTVNKTVLTIDAFRQALSWSLNREEFNLALSPTSGIAKGLLSSMIVADPEAGIMYRDTDAAKDAILEFWGLADAWGEGKEYATRDDAIASITGYDLAGAKALFTQAYNEAVEQELLTAEQIAAGNWEVQILVGMPAEATFYNDGYEFLKTNWTNAVAGTPFEGHVTFKKSQVLGSTSFGTYLRNGSVDMLFGVGYGGSMFNPFSMMDCFTGSLQYDPLTDKTSVMLDVTIDLGDGEKTYRASLYSWVSECLLGTDITATIIDADGNATAETKTFNAGASVAGEIRTAILAQCETKILTLSNIFPIQTDSSASLRCMRVNYKTENYVLGMGRGGIQYYTYAMTDDDFLAYAAQQEGGVLNYKA
jgi:ABC-type oligopeptide transport system substrate-binding subunit